MANSNFLEKNLETIIFETPNDRLTDRGLEIDGYKKQQVRIGGYGIADIICLSRDTDVHVDRVYQVVNIHIYELKKDKIDANTMMQAYRYLKGIKRYFEKRKVFKGVIVNYIIHLIGKEICMGDFAYLLGVIPNMNAYTYSYDFDGITFNNEHSYYLREENFNGK